MAVYPYKQLDLARETRILTVLPGGKGDDILCSLSHMEIENGGAYDALSYCWGQSVTHPHDPDDEVVCQGPGEDAEPLRMKASELVGLPDWEYVYIKHGGVLPEGKILCDGIETVVGGELLNALKHMRHAEDPLRLWVDALCINQSDLKERNEHVKMMGKIYANASSVRVWLGGFIGVEDAAFQAFKTIQTVFEELSEGLEGADVQKQEPQAMILSHPSWYAIEWDAIAEFIGRAWFERIWVVQEIAYAKDALVCVGPYKIPWNALCSIFRLLRTYSLDQIIPNPPATKALAIMDLMQSSQLNGTLDLTNLQLLERLRGYKSTFASDKIYGVLGLMTEKDMVEVDYAKSPENVFTDFAVKHLQSGSLDILHHCVDSSQPTTLDLPSWVPDWTRPGWVEPFRIRGLGASAAGNTKPQFHVDKKAGTLRIKGRILDAVNVVEQEYEIPLTKFNPHWTNLDETDPREKTKAKFMREQRNMYDAWENMVRLAWPTPESFSWQKYENMWRNFMCNRTRENEIPGDGFGKGWETVLWWICWHTSEDKNTVPYTQTIIPTNPREGVVGDAGAEAKMATVLGAHRRWCYHRRFYVSETERYGWAVDGTLPGDKVVLFYGSDYPFVIREIEGGTYRIIGDCYIHGLMDGQGLDAEFAEREFVIV